MDNLYKTQCVSIKELKMSKEYIVVSKEKTLKREELILYASVLNKMCNRFYLLQKIIKCVEEKRNTEISKRNKIT